MGINHSSNSSGEYDRYDDYSRRGPLHEWDLYHGYDRDWARNRLSQSYGRDDEYEYPSFSDEDEDYGDSDDEAYRYNPTSAGRGASTARPHPNEFEFWSYTNYQSPASRRLRAQFIPQYTASSLDPCRGSTQMTAYPGTLYSTWNDTVLGNQDSINLLATFFSSSIGPSVPYHSPSNYSGAFGAGETIGSRFGFVSNRWNPDNHQTNCGFVTIAYLLGTNARDLANSLNVPQGGLTQEQIAGLLRRAGLKFGSIAYPRVRCSPDYRYGYIENSSFLQFPRTFGAGFYYPDPVRPGEEAAHACNGRTLKGNKRKIKLRCHQMVEEGRRIYLDNKFLNFLFWVKWPRGYRRAHRVPRRRWFSFSGMR